MIRFLLIKPIVGGMIFLNPVYETSLDADDSITLNPDEIPMVTVRKRIRSVSQSRLYLESSTSIYSYKLGPPYGKCKQRTPTNLTHFHIYTKAWNIEPAGSCLHCTTAIIPLQETLHVSVPN